MLARRKRDAEIMRGERQPLHHPGKVCSFYWKPFVRGIIGAGKMRENGLRAVQHEVAIPQDWQPPRRIKRQIRRRKMFLAGKNVDGDSLPLKAQQRQRKADLVAALIQFVSVENERRRPDRSMA